jgi:hypothetical protein
MLHINAYYKRMFQVFQLFHTYVASVSFGYCICFVMATHMFSSVSDVCYKCFNCFGCLLQSASSTCCKSKIRCSICYSGTQLPQLRVGAEGAQVAGVGNEAGAD